MLLSKLLDRLIQQGTLIVFDAFGNKHVFGHSDPCVTIRLHDSTLHWKLFFNPLLYTGEAYMDETLTISDGTLYDFLALIGINRVHTHPHYICKITNLLYHLFRRLHQFNTTRIAKKNVAHHYDLSCELYDLFLDTRRQYSCAYFPTGNEDLETAQLRKLQLITSKLLIEPEQQVLDIGSGWGGLALHLAKQEQCTVTGLTLSEEQLHFAVSRAQKIGMENQTNFQLRDYRNQSGKFDRIVSVGMFEHVGIGHYGEYFDKIAALLDDQGIALLHTIGRSDGPGITNPWIRKYIFPGGYIPALSEIVRAIEQSGLIITDLEVLRLHYAETLRYWRSRFMANWNEAVSLYDERFCRMWEFYLVSSEVSFRFMDNVVFQIQLAKRHDAVPLVRNYIMDRPGESARQYKSEDHSRAA